MLSLNSIVTCSNIIALAIVDNSSLRTNLYKSSARFVPFSFCLKRNIWVYHYTVFTCCDHILSFTVHMEYRCFMLCVFAGEELLLRIVIFHYTVSKAKRDHFVFVFSDLAKSCDFLFLSVQSPSFIKFLGKVLQCCLVMYEAESTVTADVHFAHCWDILVGQVCQRFCFLSLPYFEAFLIGGEC